MPGNVAAPSVGSPVRVMPRALATAFSETRSYPGDQNQYVDGSSQRAAHAIGSARVFRFTNRDLTGALRQFYEDTGNQAFYFYFWKEGAHDPTGASSTGRYICVFEANYSEALGMLSEEVQVVIRQVQ